MTGADGTYDYKAMGGRDRLGRGRGHGAICFPWSRRNLLHYRILDAIDARGFLLLAGVPGRTSLRLCHGSPRYSEDLDFTGGTSFDMDTLKGLGSCIVRFALGEWAMM